MFSSKRQLDDGRSHPDHGSCNAYGMTDPHLVTSCESTAMDQDDEDDNSCMSFDSNCTEQQLTACTTMGQVAESLQRSSFALYRVNAKVQHLIQQSSQEAHCFFHQQQSNSNSKVDNYQRIIQGHLHGYNEPSKAKELFRAFCSSPQQPWPTATLQQSSTQLATCLHELLADCWNTVERQQSAKRVKRRVLSQDGCPLDFFLYHGTNNKIVNCSEHVDRGVLIAICLSDVPGLEILKRNGDWMCPEEEAGKPNGSLIAILAGQQLSDVSSGVNIPACVHRVRNGLAKERLSVSYELRHTER